MLLSVVKTRTSQGNVMKTRYSVVSAVVGVVLSATAAHAATTDLGPIAVNVPTSFGGYADGSFSDIFTFSLPANGGSGYSVANFTALPALLNTVLATMSLVSNPDGILFNGDDFMVKSSVFPGGNLITMTYGPSAGGPMYLNVTGITNGPQGGIYTGAISVTAVPEPEPYVMLLAGLGVVGFVAARRRPRR